MLGEGGGGGGEEGLRCKAVEVSDTLMSPGNHEAFGISGV